MNIDFIECINVCVRFKFITYVRSRVKDNLFFHFSNLVLENLGFDSQGLTVFLSKEQAGNVSDYQAQENGIQAL